MLMIIQKSKLKYFLPRKQHKCPYPCTLINVRETSVKEQSGRDPDVAYLLLRFKDNVSVIESYYSKNIHSLISDIGGYIAIGSVLIWIILKINERFKSNQFYGQSIERESRNSIGKNWSMKARTSSITSVECQ